jgi:anti-sigma-K factor RskA
MISRENGALSGLVAQHPLPYDDLVLYAMQFLSPEEAEAIEQRLAASEESRLELARIQGDLATYALTADLHSPPAAARERMWKQVRREKKFVAHLSQEIPAVTPGRSLEPLRSSDSGLGDVPLQSGLSSFGRGSSLFVVPEERPRTLGRNILTWSGWAVAAGLGITAGLAYRERDDLRGLLATQAAQIAQLTDDSAKAHQLTDAFTDPKAIRVTLTRPKATPAPTGRVTYDADKGSLIFIAGNLDPLQMYKVYELWLIPPVGNPMPAGVFHPDEHGNASVILPELPKGVVAKAFGVTVEDDGGSPKPTLPIVMAGS